MKHDIKHLFFLAVLAVLFQGFALEAASASETSELFTQCVGNFAAEDLNVRKDAQQKWQTHCRSLGPKAEARAEATKLMIEQLGKDNPVETNVWIIRQLGITADDSAVPVLLKSMKSEEIRVADEAARALANIPGAKAAEALKSVDSQLAKDALKEHDRDRSVRVQAGNEKDMPLGLPYAEQSVVDEWMKGYDQFDNDNKVRALAAMSVRKDKKYLPQAIAAVASENDALHNAGLLALASMGGTKELPVVLNVAFNGKNRDLAKVVLSRMVDDGFDAELEKALKAEKDWGKFEVLADIANRRYFKSALPIILERAAAADCPIRHSLLNLSENLAGKDEIAGFVAVWEKITDRGQKDQAEQVIARIVSGDAEPILKLRTEKNYVEMFSLLGRIGDEKSLKEIRDRVFKRPLDAGLKASPELSAAALRAMCNWSDAKFAEDLLLVADSDSFSPPDRIQALRAYVRVITLPNDRIGIRINDRQRLERLAKAMEMARRPDERQLILQRIGATPIRNVEALKFLLKYIDEERYRDTVCRSILDVVHDTNFRRNNKDAAFEAIDKVIAVSKDNGQIDRAKKYKENL